MPLCYSMIADHLAMAVWLLRMLVANTDISFMEIFLSQICLRQECYINR